MLTLYYKPTCKFSRKVLEEAERMGVHFNQKNIAENETFLAELIEKGGKRQTPFLEDPEMEESMYESEDIIAYLEKNYADEPAAAASDKPRVHVSGSTCVSCEG